MRENNKPHISGLQKINRTIALIMIIQLGNYKQNTYVMSRVLSAFNEFTDQLLMHKEVLCQDWNRIYPSEQEPHTQEWLDHQMQNLKRVLSGAQKSAHERDKAVRFLCLWHQHQSGQCPDSASSILVI